MSRLVTSVLVAMAVAGCAKNTARPTLKMNGPTGIAVYRGYGASQPGVLRHLLAVSNTRGDDLRIIDAVTDQGELGPTLVAALSVPTEPRPSLIAAGRLGDVDAELNPLARPDLLVVAPSGLVQRPGFPGQYAAVLQAVVTWEEATRVEAPVDLGGVAPDEDLLSLVVTPVLEPDGAGGFRVRPGAARIVAGLTGGALVTIEASRVAGGEAIELGPPARQDPGFTALDLAVSPDGRYLYAATIDPIPGAGGVLGVAQLDLAPTSPPGPFPVRAIAARAGTTRVAALDVAPFVDSNYEASVPNFDEFGPAVPRVLAAIDTRACGRDRSMPCGVAVLDPVAGGPAPDPAGELPFQFPLQVDGEVVDLAVSGAPLHSTVPGYLELAPGSGKRWTQSIASISSSSGRVYLADLSHFAIANDISSLTGSSRARVISSASYAPSVTSNTVGFWQLLPPSGTQTEWVVLVDIQAAFGVVVTPGFTPNDTWSVAYQGVLPGLGSRLALARVPAGAPQAPVQVALQEATGLTGPGSEAWRSVVRVYDPRLAIQPFDIVEFGGFPAGVCPLGQFEMVVTGLLPPTADAPGGAIALTPAATQPINPGQTEPANPTCLPAGAETPLRVTVRSWGYVAAGQRAGYVGRPVEVFDPTDTTIPMFQVRYENEDLLSCPIMPDAPADWPPPAGAVAACEADVISCRATCERLVLARRARRLFYVTNRCSEAKEPACYGTWAVPPASLVFPLPNGPLVSFRVGVIRPNGGYAPPDRGAYVTFSTASGFVPSVRVPYTGGVTSGAVLPGGVLLHDRSEATGSTADGIHGFATFTGNMVLDFAASAAAQNATTIR